MSDVKSSRSASEIQLLRKHNDIAIESKLDAGIHGASRITRYLAIHLCYEGRAVERVKKLGVAFAEILRQMSSPLVTLYPLRYLERECEGKVSRELVEE